MSFREASREVERRVQALSLNILVWGSGPASDEHYAKRIQVRDLLKAQFAAADVFFSEDLPDVPEGGPYLDVHERELWHLASCDVCVVLDTSKGPGEEIAYFATTREAHKLLVLTHERDRNTGSFPSALRRNLNQQFYTEDEYAACDIVKRVLARVRQVGLTKLLRA